MAMTIAELKEHAQARRRAAEREIAKAEAAEREEMEQVIRAARKIEPLWTDAYEITATHNYGPTRHYWNVTYKLLGHCDIQIRMEQNSLKFWERVQFTSGDYRNGRTWRVLRFSGTAIDEDGAAYAEYERREFVELELGEALLYAEEHYTDPETIQARIDQHTAEYAIRKQNEQAAAALSPTLTAWERLQDALSEIIADAIADTIE